jgi:hypothetical protein
VGQGGRAEAGGVCLSGGWLAFAGKAAGEQRGGLPGRWA